MPTCHIDHITILSPSLAVGGEWVHELLGVYPQQGGEHPRMGTHNLLVPLGDTVFLEIIAFNPNAAKPPRPRWFGLDPLPPNSKPFLGCWVARTHDIESSLAAAPENLGVAEPMSRGALEWLISISQDGNLPLGGTAPALIQWPAGAHPARSLQDKGCRLAKLALLHPEPQRLKAVIGSLQFTESSIALSVSEAASPGLVAHILTPHGLRTIGREPPDAVRST
ncbi:VOC family protein [Nostoc sp. NIES-2111]